MPQTDYLPRYLPGDQLPVTTGTGGSVAGGLITTTGVIPSDADIKVAGVAGVTAPAGVAIPVYRVGLHIGFASGSIANGDPICAAAPATINGVSTPRVRTWVAGTDAVAARIGKAWSVGTNNASVTYSLFGV